MSNPKSQTFGSELRNARERCRVRPQSGGNTRSMSQEKFAEYIAQELGGGTYPSLKTVSAWETGEAKPDDRRVPGRDKEKLLAAIVKVLYTHGGIKTAAEATALLKLGSWSLKDTHLDTIFGIGWRTSTQSPTDPLILAQALLATLPLDHVPEPATLPPGSRMTLRSNPFFTGRADDLRALAADLKAGRAAAITTGIGGVGKTQLAADSPRATANSSPAASSGSPSSSQTTLPSRLPPVVVQARWSSTPTRPASPWMSRSPAFARPGHCRSHACSSSTTATT